MPLILKLVSTTATLRVGVGVGVRVCVCVRVCVRVCVCVGVIEQFLLMFRVMYWIEIVLICSLSKLFLI